MRTSRSTEHGARRRAVSENQRTGQLSAVREVQAWRSEITRAIDQVLEIRPPIAGHVDLRAQPLTRLAQGGVDERVGRVQLGGDLVLDHRLLEAIESGETTGREGVILRGPELDAPERGARVDVARVRAHYFRVLRDRAVVVEGLLGLPGGAHGRGRGAAREQDRQQQRPGSLPVNGPMSRR